tara:strand:+ start:107 stop:820 length:714 start_codon:yes stop_codon:yes gene_type:complete
MDTKYNFFIFVDYVPMNITKGAIYISPYGEDFVNIFRSIKQYEDNVGKIVEDDFTKNIFVDRGQYENVIEFRVENPHIPRDCLFLKTDDSIKKITDKLKAGEKFNTYDIFSGKSMANISLDDQLASKSYLKVFFYVMLQYMNAGYHKRQNTKKIPDWCVCFSEPVMEYFIEYFEIKSQSEDITVVDEFLTNPQFREMITIQMMKVLANYIINNKISRPSEIISWQDINVWIKLKNSF